MIVTFSACLFTLCRGFFTPKIVGTFYMQGYKDKEKTAIVPPVSKLSGHPDFLIITNINYYLLTTDPVAYNLESLFVFHPIYNSII